jgi:hypothetical protein
MQSFTKLYTVIQVYKKLYKVIQVYKKLYTVIQVYAKFYKVIRCYTNVCKVIQMLTFGYKGKVSQKKMVHASCANHSFLMKTVIYYNAKVGYFCETTAKLPTKKGLCHYEKAQTQFLHGTLQTKPMQRY